MPEPLVYFVSGMWCGTCARTVNAAASRVAGVHRAQVNYVTKLLRVELQDAAVPDEVDRDLCATVTASGFGVRRLQRNWLRTFTADLRLEQERAFSLLRIAGCWFFAMWSSMFAFAQYLGQLSSAEEYDLALTSTLLGLPAIGLGIVPFARAGGRALFSSRLLTFDLFIALGGVAASLISLRNLSQGLPVTYADSAAMVLAVLLSAKRLETALTGHLTDRILYRLGQATEPVAVFRGGQWRPAEVEQIRRGDRLRFQAGQTILCDGQCASERAVVNCHLLHGEDLDTAVKQGDGIYAGSIARSELELLVQQPVGTRHIDAWAESALLAPGRPHWSADRFRQFETTLIVVALCGSLLIGLQRYASGAGAENALQATLMGMLVFCPCLFATVLPFSRQLAHIGLARSGILLYRSEALLDLAEVTELCLDKTGTLEAVESSLEVLEPAGNWIPLLAEVARRCPHPVLRGLTLPACSDCSLEHLEEFPGLGVEACTRTGQRLRVGRAVFVRGRPGGDEEDALVSYEGRVVGRIVSRSASDARARQALEQLLQLVPGPVSILSGDPRSGAAERYVPLAPDRIKYHGNLTPHEKAAHLHSNAMFIGDGLNDTPALSAAKVSCRVGQRVGDFVPVDFHLLRPDLRLLPRMVRYARRYRRILAQTVVLGFTYNAVALTLVALDAFSPFGAVLAMLSSLTLLTLSVLRLTWGEVSEGGVAPF